MNACARLFRSSAGPTAAVLVLAAVSAAAGPVSSNLLDNAGFEADLAGWTTDHGAIRAANPDPHGGAKYLMGATDGASLSYTFQVVDLVAAGFDLSELDSGELEIRFGGWQAGWSTQTDRGLIEIIVSDDSGPLETSDLGWFWSNYTWTLKEGRIPLPAGARGITYGFHAERHAGTNNDAYLDDAFLMLTTVIPAPIFTGIRRGNGTMTLGIAGLTPGRTNTVEASTDLGTGSWTDLDSFVAGATFTNWSGPLNQEWARGAYRLRSD